MIKTSHYIEYFLVILLAFFVQLIPLKYLHRVGFLIAKFLYPFLKSRKNIAIQNLRFAFPDKTNKELEAIAKNSFKNITTTLIELLWYPNYSKELIKKRVIIENFEIFAEAKKENKGVIFLSAHFGSWELAMQAISIYSKETLFTVAKPQSNLLVDKYINKLRELFGLKIISMGISIREILRTLNNNGIVGIAADQSAPKESIEVNFFGRKVPTFQGPAIFSLKTGAPIVLGCTLRKNDGSYIMKLQTVPSKDLNGATEENILMLTQRHVKMTEEIIHNNPEQWMWMHKRWKHV